MNWFIKTERFTKKTLALSLQEREKNIEKHKDWIIKLNKSGVKISSGYLVDSKQTPGGGGLLILQAKSYEEAQEIIKEDPMISNDLVIWELHEWIQVGGTLINKFI